ncbi:hypothetical protein [Streptomyces sp. BA2]|uniref:hypothetical protein n=1 Tax=Streptomyces sp. BA2 TaxID=436595 RepID=UPI00132714A1|nr:hypothetical protein [Streptomyces sp. BA2]MWA15962.1 hypothetical protein [Streptomyces sp. BA2]
MKVGITRQELAELRANGKEARDKGYKSLPVPDGGVRKNEVAPNRTSGKPAKPAKPLTVLEGARASNQAAADNARGAAPAAEAGDAGVTADDENNYQGWVPIGDEPNEERLDACYEGDGAGTGIGRIYNRFTYCSRVGLSIESWEIDGSGVPVELEGTTSADMKIFGQGDAKNRRTRIFATIEEDSVDYDWGPIDDWWTAPKIAYNQWYVEAFTDNKANRDHKNGACFKTRPERETYRDTGLPNGTERWGA